MRTLTIALTMAFLSGVAVSCAQQNTTQQKTTPKTAPRQKTAVLTSEGKAVLSMSVPADAKTYPENGKLMVTDAKRYSVFYVWPVTKAKTVDAAVDSVGDIIKGEFTNFKQTGTKNLTVAGNPAKMVTGTGLEADDGDPGSAEVVLFKVDNHIFAACIHGEGEPTDKMSNFMMNALQTSKVPHAAPGRPAK